MAKKYIKVDKRTIQHPLGVGSIAVWRVKALVDIPMHDVKAGTVGGFIDRSSTLSQTGNAWIGGFSYVLDGSVVMENALVDSKAVISETTVEGNAIVNGDARINSIPGTPLKSKISEFAKIGEFARLSNSDVSGYSVVAGKAVVYHATVEGESKILGFTKVHGPSYIFDSEIFGEAKIEPGTSILESSIHCASVIREDLDIENSEVFGTTVLKEEASAEVLRNDETIHKSETHPKCMIRGVEISSCKKIISWDNMRPNTIVYVSPNSIASADKQREKWETKKVAPKISAMDVKRFEEILVAYSAYETDIVKIIKYPAMSDMTDPYTANFHSLLRTVRRHVENNEINGYKETINLLEDAYYVAESNARKVANSLFDDADKSKIATAKQMLAITMDKASSDTEKKNALKGALRNLEGRIAVPEKALFNLREMVGLKEIEA